MDFVWILMGLKYDWNENLKFRQMKKFWLSDRNFCHLSHLSDEKSWKMKCRFWKIEKLKQICTYCDYEPPNCFGKSFYSKLTAKKIWDRYHHYWAQKSHIFKKTPFLGYTTFFTLFTLFWAIPLFYPFFWKKWYRAPVNNGMEIFLCWNKLQYICSVPAKHFWATSKIHFKN